MNDLNFKIYASVEIKPKLLLFSVVKSIGNKVIVLFKRELENSKGWLNEKDEVINPNLVAQNLEELINTYEYTHNGFKIMNVSLILPSTHLKISEKYREISLLQDVHHEFGIASRLTINELKTTLRQTTSTVNYVVVDSKPLVWTLDNVPTELALVSKTKAKKLGLTALVYQLPTRVYQTHTQVISAIDRSLLLTTFNITELYRLVTKQKTNHLPMLVTNWNEQNLEVGYFENGALKSFEVLQFGMNALIATFAKKLHLKPELAKNYVFNLIDFSSNNNIDANIFQKWDFNQRILKKYTTLEITQFLNSELNHYYSQVKDLAKHCGMYNRTINYNFGLIQKIPGVETLLRSHNSFANDYVYNNFIFGMGSTTNFNAAVGVVQSLERINSNPENHWVRTSIGSFQKHPQPTMVPHQPPPYQFASRTKNFRKTTVFKP